MKMMIWERGCSKSQRDIDGLLYFKRPCDSPFRRFETFLNDAVDRIGLPPKSGPGEEISVHAQSKRLKASSHEGPDLRSEIDRTAYSVMRSYSTSRKMHYFDLSTQDVLIRGARNGGAL